MLSVSARGEKITKWSRIEKDQQEIRKAGEELFGPREGNSFRLPFNFIRANNNK